MVVASVSRILKTLWIMANLNKLRCIACMSPITLDGLQVSMHPREDGFPLDENDYEFRFWVYYMCPKCGYQNAVKKILEGELEP
jgi:hypothetical protein